MANGVDTWTFKVRDSAKLVALLVLVGGGVANYYIFKSDLREQGKRVRQNAEAIGGLTHTVHEHDTRNAVDSERHEALTEKIKRIERQIRRYHGQ
jgi:hypothetical protein